MSAADHLSTRQFFPNVREDYITPGAHEYAPAEVAEVDPRTLTATQGHLTRPPSMRRITRPTLPRVYADESIGENVIADGHHRLAAHIRAGRSARVQMWRKKATS